MSPIFAHRTPAPENHSNYRKYASYIREDFKECCAFCLLHEIWASGAQNFELDHFKPKSKFPELVSEYTNLYYTCHVCNNTKRDQWPVQQLQDEGFRFIDFCAEDYSTNFRDENGRWIPLTRAGEYTIDRLRLNSPGRVSIRRAAADYLHHLGVQSIDWDRPLLEQIQILLDKVGGETEIEQALS